MSLLQEMQQLRHSSINEEYDNFKNEIKKLVKDNPKVNVYNLVYKHQEPLYSNLNCLIKTKLMDEGFVLSDYVDLNDRTGLTIIVPMHSNIKF